MLVTSCVLEMLSDTRWVINYVGVIVINIPISRGGVVGVGWQGRPVCGIEAGLSLGCYVTEIPGRHTNTSYNIIIKRIMIA